MPRDFLDQLIADWRRQRPDLDPSGMEVCGRILRIADRLKQRLGERLRHLGLGVGGYGVLATLRRAGPPYRLTPTQLTRSVLLTSGAMTNRIDRLEAAGLVERLRPPGDRRSILVGLTPSGAQLADVATPIRLDEARAALAGLTPQEARQLADLLRAMALTLEGEASAR